eukprot:c14526_g1_i1 orf=401-625(+)
MLPCVIFFRDGIARDRLVGFQDLGGNDDFPTTVLENWLLKKGAILNWKTSEEDTGVTEAPRTLRSTNFADSDSE